MNDIPKIEMFTAEETHIRSGLAKCHICLLYTSDAADD